MEGKNTVSNIVALVLAYRVGVLSSCRKRYWHQACWKKDESVTRYTKRDICDSL